MTINRLRKDAYGYAIDVSDFIFFETQIMSGTRIPNRGKTMKLSADKFKPISKPLSS